MQLKTKSFLKAGGTAQRVMDAHDVEFGGVKSTGARANFDQAIAQVTVLCNLQDPLGYRSSQEQDIAGAVRVRIRKQFMTPVSRIAKAQNGELPGRRQLRLPATTLHKVDFIAAGREMVTAVSQHAELFIKAGLAADFLSRFAAELDAYDDAATTRTRGQKGRVGVTAAIKTAVSEGVKAIRILDSLIAPNIESNPQLIAEWASTMAMFSRMYRGSVSVDVAPARVTTPAETPTAVPVEVLTTNPAAAESGGAEVASAEA